MKYTRRDMLITTAAALPAIAVRGFGEVQSPKSEERRSKRLGIVSDSYAQHIASDRQQGGGNFTDPLMLLEHVHESGAGGAQIPLGVRDSAYTSKLRAKTEAYQMYLEGSVRMPVGPADIEKFAAEVRTASQAGAGVVRTVMLGGRRYEAFDKAETFKSWADRAFQSLVAAERIVAHQQIRLAVENHKDWRWGELAAILKRLSSAHVGACVDTGNNIALLEDPHEVVDALAPWAFSTHLKDMAVREYADGFLLSEVPLGEGFLDLRRIVATLARARPEVQFSLEMITRDPLRIPCLTAKYWATFEQVPGRDLARTLSMVRDHARRTPLPETSRLSRERKVELEEKNIRRCLDYARENLEL
jgi:sugar phosphate isomerase/epimerase